MHVPTTLRVMNIWLYRRSSAGNDGNEIETKQLVHLKMMIACVCTHRCILLSSLSFARMHVRTRARTLSFYLARSPALRMTVVRKKM